MKIMLSSAVLISIVVSVPTCYMGDQRSIPRWGGNTPFGASLVVQTVKNPPSMRETWVRSLGWEDPLEEGMATHSSILAHRGAWWATVHGVAESDTTERLSAAHLLTSSKCYLNLFQKLDAMIVTGYLIFSPCHLLLLAFVNFY